VAAAGSRSRFFSDIEGQVTERKERRITTFPTCGVRAEIRSKGKYKSKPKTFLPPPPSSGRSTCSGFEDRAPTRLALCQMSLLSKPQRPNFLRPPVSFPMHPPVLFLALPVFLPPLNAVLGLSFSSLLADVSRSQCLSRGFPELEISVLRPFARPMLCTTTLLVSTRTFPAKAVRLPPASWNGFFLIFPFSVFYHSDLNQG